MPNAVVKRVPLHRLGDGFTLLPAGDSGGGERLRGGQRRILGEVDDIDRRLVPVEQQFDGVFERFVGVFVGQRDRPGRVGDDVDVGVGHVLEFVGDGVDVAEGGAHQQELGARQGQQRHLPGPAAFRIAVVMEFVHRHAADIGVTALAQRLLARISAVQQMIGASALICVSPVIMPT